jgi:hypothetical protein
MTYPNPKSDPVGFALESMADALRRADGRFLTVVDLQSLVFPELQRQGLYITGQWGVTFEGGKMHYYRIEPNPFLETLLLANHLVSSKKNEFEGTDHATGNPKYRWKKPSG